MSKFWIIKNRKVRNFKLKKKKDSIFNKLFLTIFFDSSEWGEGQRDPGCNVDIQWH